MHLRAIQRLERKEFRCPQCFSSSANVYPIRTRRIQGLLYWGVCFWHRAVEDSRKTGRYWPEAEWHANQFPDGNGDGYLIYPDVKNHCVYGSLRLSVLRDGLEDMEYFLLLDSRKNKARKRNLPQDREWLRKAEELEKEIPQVIANETKEKGRYVSRDYNGDLLEAVRERLGDLLDDFPVNP